MKYISTRGAAPTIGFADALLAGLATDGGLYLPEFWPTLPPLDELRGRTYSEVAAKVMWPFVEEDIDRDVFDSLVAEAYSVFDDPRVCPVVDLGVTASGASHHLVELFHGPTFAFKDVALQLVGRLFDHFLTERGERVCILGATSGDTGSAAIDSVVGRDAIDIFILFPEGRVSEVQRRQMTTVDSPNVHAVAVAGNFDDCQDLVKAAFADEAFRNGVHLSAVNSINWARVMAQIVYYVTAALEVNGAKAPVSFSVPTGNFGNILAGWVAKQMGLPIERLIVASNSNDILTRFFTTGTLEIREVIPTSSPSMDIQISSNLERLLFEVLGRDGRHIAEMLTNFRSSGVTSVEMDALERLGRSFDARRVTENEVAATIRSIHAETNMIIDPHTAVAVRAAIDMPGSSDTPVISLSTAHPAKFPDAVSAALGERPPVPAKLARVFDLPERTTSISNDLTAVKHLILSRI
ncbi:MAG: threonine synthase [Microthrixaceae bacterium]